MTESPSSLCDKTVKLKARLVLKSTRKIVSTYQKKELEVLLCMQTAPNRMTISRQKPQTTPNTM